MAGTTLAEAEAQRAATLAALLAVKSRGQSYSMEGRAAQRAELEALNKDYDKWDRIVRELSGDASTSPKIQQIDRQTERS